MIKQGAQETEFFTEYGEASQYQIQEVVGKGSYGVVGSAIDTHTGEKVAISVSKNIFWLQITMKHVCCKKNDTLV